MLRRCEERRVRCEIGYRRVGTVSSHCMPFLSHFILLMSPFNGSRGVFERFDYFVFRDLWFVIAQWKRLARAKGCWLLVVFRSLFFVYHFPEPLGCSWFVVGDSLFVVAQWKKLPRAEGYRYNSNLFRISETNSCACLITSSVLEESISNISR